MSEELKKQMQDMERLMKINETLIQNVKKKEEIEEKDKEIERLKEELRISKMSDKDTYETSQEIMAEQSKEIERLHSIIKEVREYIKKNYPVCAGSELLEILDKVGSDNE